MSIKISTLYALLLTLSIRATVPPIGNGVENSNSAYNYYQRYNNNNTRQQTNHNNRASSNSINHSTNNSDSASFVQSPCGSGRNERLNNEGKN